MRFKILFISVLCTLTANAAWKTLHSLDYYGPKAYTLKEGVAHVEVRKYETFSGSAPDNKKRYSYKKVTTVLRMSRKALSSFSNKTQDGFKRLPAKQIYGFKKGWAGGRYNSRSWYHNGFMLDFHGKMWRLEYIQDVVEMVKPIDTPAELRLILWLHSKDDDFKEKYSAKYRKSGNIYMVEENYEITDGDRGCGNFTYRYKINRSGKIIQKKLLRKKDAKFCGVAD